LNELLARCPVCGGILTVERLKCRKCGTTIEGNFQLNEFAALDRKNLEFLRLYLKNRGNLSKVAEIMKISYPTAISRFNDLLRALGYESREEYEDTKDILEKLEKGEIDVKEALKMLRGE